MPYFRDIPGLDKMLALFSREERWLIVISADPDAMASALALKRIMSRRVMAVDIAKINEITRPDNLAMIRYAHIHMKNYRPALRAKYHKFAMVDSQPHHSPMFKNIPFSLIIDHHPLPGEGVVVDPVPYVDIRPDYGATSTMMTEYLYSLDLRPGKLLATALQFGIKTDTASFERHFHEVDLRAYQYLSKFADHALLSRISRREYYRAWLEYIVKASNNMYAVGPAGQYVFAHDIENPDILVIIADFFMRVYEIRWVAVTGIYKNTVITVLRGDSIYLDAGRLAVESFGDIGSAGGHKAMARAEFGVAKAEGKDIEMFCLQRLTAGMRKTRRMPRKAAPEAPTAEGAAVKADAAKPGTVAPAARPEPAPGSGSKEKDLPGASGIKDKA